MNLSDKIKMQNENLKKIALNYKDHEHVDKFLADADKILIKLNGLKIKKWLYAKRWVN